MEYDNGGLLWLAERLDVDPDKRGNQICFCPLHPNFDSPAGSINFEKGLFNCFTNTEDACTVEELYHKMREEEDDSEEDGYAEDGCDGSGTVGGLPPASGGAVARDNLRSDDDVEADILRFLEERELANLPPQIDWGISEGYFIMQHKPTEYMVRRRMDDGPGPRYKNSGGKAPLFWLGDESSTSIWLTEGVLDAWALWDAGVPFVAASLGSSVSDEQAFQLRDFDAVFVVYDADHAGYKGARKTKEKLAEYDVPCIILDWPLDQGKDPCEAPRSVRLSWVKEQLSEYGQNDENYVRSLLTQHEPIDRLSTGIAGWDKILGGGMVPGGLNVVGAEPGIGKTTWACSFARRMVLEGYRVLYVSNEPTKREIWSRIMAGLVTKSWTEIEHDPTQVDAAYADKIARLGKYLRVARMWGLTQIEYALRKGSYDVVIVDYLQQMPHPNGSKDDMVAISANARGLANLVSDTGVVGVVISSLPRSSYDNEFSLRSFKGSGDIEYAAESATGLLPVVGSTNGVVVGVVAKARRGTKGGTFGALIDYEHQMVAGEG